MAEHKPKRYDFLTYIAVNPARYNVLSLLSNWAGGPPRSPHDAIDELKEAGRLVYPAQATDEFRRLGKFGLVSTRLNRQQLGGSFEIQASDFWEAYSQLAKATDKLFPPTPDT